MYWSIIWDKQNKAGFFSVVLLRIFTMLTCTETPRGKRGVKRFGQILWPRNHLFANHLRGPMLRLEQCWETLQLWLKGAEPATGSFAFTSLCFFFCFVPIPPATQLFRFLSFGSILYFLSVKICGALILNELK